MGTVEDRAEHLRSRLWFRFSQEEGGKRRQEGEERGRQSLVPDKYD